MAVKQFTVRKSMRYGTRMLRPGDPVEMDDPTARLYTALGAIGPRDADGSGKVIQPAVTAPAPKAPAKPKPAAKKAPAKKKAAKKAK